MKVTLTKGLFALIDDADFDLVSGFKWCAKKDGKTYYAQTHVRREDGSLGTATMHRLLLGLTDPKIKTDHVNGNGLDNRRVNLRVCTQAENGRNRGVNANSASGLKGVCWHKGAGKWMASIRANGKKKHLGLHATPEAAHAAYCRAANELHGEFCNFGQPAFEVPT